MKVQKPIKKAKINFKKNYFKIAKKFLFQHIIINFIALQILKGKNC